ncbi:hypothetical protein QW060_26695 [Myroides ceti]|uniref:Uncharacterized protein n=1 Tax=Paenimyroides ceti TaxID=395087 RepID=A0ABT8D1Z9_9FLAO|nr:hypothetical protein [Paenimyroides ceti]MDN3710411.1 hypothetical protein [Paenimyroides ceti]
MAICQYFQWYYSADVFGYYLSVNLQFINQTMNPDDVAFELQRWEMIHIARTILAILSTVLAIVAYFRYEENGIQK